MSHCAGATHRLEGQTAATLCTEVACFELSHNQVWFLSPCCHEDLVRAERFRSSPGMAGTAECFACSTSFAAVVDNDSPRTAENLLSSLLLLRAADLEPLENILEARALEHKILALQAELSV